MASAAKVASKIKTVVFLGSVREGRYGDRVAKFIVKQLEEANHHVDLLDPLVLPAPVVSKPLHHYKDYKDAPVWLVQADEKLRAADAVVVVSAEYNHTIPPALSNLMDHFPLASYAFKPSAIVCYSLGPYGGMRAAMALRCFLGELGCISVGNIFGIPSVSGALDPDGKPTNEFMLPGAKTVITQLEWHARAMANHREAVGIPK